MISPIQHFFIRKKIGHKKYCKLVAEMINWVNIWAENGCQLVFYALSPSDLAILMRTANFMEDIVATDHIIGNKKIEQDVKLYNLLLNNNVMVIMSPAAEGSLETMRPG